MTRGERDLELDELQGKIIDARRVKENLELQTNQAQKIYDDLCQSLEDCETDLDDLESRYNKLDAMDDEDFTENPTP